MFQFTGETSETRQYELKFILVSTYDCVKVGCTCNVLEDRSISHFRIVMLHDDSIDIRQSDRLQWVSTDSFF